MNLDSHLHLTVLYCKVYNPSIGRKFMKANRFTIAQVHTHNHLAIAAAYCRAIKVKETVNRLVPSRMEVDPGTVVVAMLLDTLGGRSPLYRLADTFEEKDLGLLLGSSIPASSLNDTNVGRVLDAIFEFGASKIITEVAIEAVRFFDIDVSVVSYDTTSTSVWGQYIQSGKKGGPKLTYGHSKDNRPDLKQFMTEMLCVGRGVPIFGDTMDGNSSDKKRNNTMLSRISSIMRRFGLGEGAFVYVVDSAMVTEENLALLGSTGFVSRLPANFKACKEVIDKAVSTEGWVPIGRLAELESSKGATYKAREELVEIGGVSYRCVVYHSDSYDRRKQKAIESEVKRSLDEIQALRKTIEVKYYCREDAIQACLAANRQHSALHEIRAHVVQRQSYRRGRPPKEGPRATRDYYELELKIQERTEKLKQLKERSGCFAILTNVKEDKLDSRGLLKTYKGQYGIESDFVFLKDPMIVNDLFLKKSERIEALGMILVLALMIYRLMERQMRMYLAEKKTLLPGWAGPQTVLPASWSPQSFWRSLSARIIGGSLICSVH
jgi:transposase